MNEREQLEQEILNLRHELSVVIPQEMKTAVEMGDLRENSEFSELVTRQQFVSIRLRQLTERLSSVKSINLNTVPRDKVGIGSFVKVKHVEANKTIWFKIIFTEVSDKLVEDHMEVTLHSPIGKSLYNKAVKDVVSVILPNGKATYKILDLTTIHDL